MSREDRDVVRAMYDAFNRADTDTILELADPAVSVEDHAVIDGATYEGRDGVVQFLRFQAEAFSAESVELEEMVETADEIVAVIRLRGEGPLSRVPLEGRLPRLADRWRNGPPTPRVRHQAGSPRGGGPAGLNTQPATGKSAVSLKTTTR